MPGAGCRSQAVRLPAHPLCLPFNHGEYVHILLTARACLYALRMSRITQPEKMQPPHFFLFASLLSICGPFTYPFGREIENLFEIANGFPYVHTQLPIARSTEHEVLFLSTHSRQLDRPPNEVAGSSDSLLVRRALVWSRLEVGGPGGVRLGRGCAPVFVAARPALLTVPLYVIEPGPKDQKCPMYCTNVQTYKLGEWTEDRRDRVVSPNWREAPTAAGRPFQHSCVSRLQRLIGGSFVTASPVGALLSAPIHVLLFLLSCSFWLLTVSRSLLLLSACLSDWVISVLKSVDCSKTPEHHPLVHLFCRAFREFSIF